MARQNTDKIADEGGFTISNRAIQAFLHLPHESETDKPKRDIRDVIEGCVDEIMTAHRQYPDANDEDFVLELFDNGEGEKKLPISEYLKGRVTVRMAGAFASPFIDLRDAATEKRRKSKERHDRIVEQATIKYLTEKMKKADKEKKGDAAETSDTESSEE